MFHSFSKKIKANETDEKASPKYVLQLLVFWQDLFPELPAHWIVV
jgi:hypothetical protein